jgi:hypothetical protein
MQHDIKSKSYFERLGRKCTIDVAGEMISGHNLPSYRRRAASLTGISNPIILMYTFPR